MNSEILRKSNISFSKGNELMFEILKHRYFKNGRKTHYVSVLSENYISTSFLHSPK